MVKSEVSCSCPSLNTTREKRWPYEEYYFGERDSEGRKSGQGEQHWTGAESLEWYIGPMLQDTMHGDGDYRWRYKDTDGSFITYEGRFFANQMHGYGVMSYPDGRVFTGLFYKDVRWGPGVERLTCLRGNVGFWRGTQLARLVWRPAGPTVAPNLANGFNGPDYLDPFRIILMKNTKIIGDTNAAIELLKYFGADPVDATKKWKRLYPKYCTDMNSALSNKDLFDGKYYGRTINSLKEAENEEQEIKVADDDNDKSKVDIVVDEDEAPSYFAWNNNAMMLHMMKHCYMHEKQRAQTKLNLRDLLNGPRKRFRCASKHEFNCRSLLLASFNGNIANVAQLVNEEDVYPDISDSQGNTALMYATCGDQMVVIHFLVEAGASVNSYNDSCCTPLGVALMRYLCVARDIPFSAMLYAVLPPREDTLSLVAQRNNIYIKSIEWKKVREVTQDGVDTKFMPKSMSSIKKLKSNIKFDTSPTHVKLHNKQEEMEDKRLYDSDDDVIYTDEKKLFLRVNEEYNSKIADQFAAVPKGNLNISYLFTARDLAKEIDAVLDEIIAATTEKKPAPVKKIPSKSKPPTIKSINQIQEEIDEHHEKIKLEILSKIDLTILQLLTDGADPTLVKCPQPAILLAVKSGCPKLVKHMVSYGVNVDQKFPDLLDYTVLDLVIAEPFSNDNLELIRALLEVGADTRHRLKLEDSTLIPDQVPVWIDGPTLLHVVILKKAEFEFEEEIRQKEIELLLQYNADPTAQYKGRSPIDSTMTKKLLLLEPFIQHPTTNLNSIINDRKHTILMKLFTKDYFKTLFGVDKIPLLTSLLLYGADPLLECYDGDVRYENMFEYAQKILNEIAPPPVREHKISPTAELNKNKSKSKSKIGKSKTKMLQSVIKLPPVPEETKKKEKGPIIDVAEYRDALSMMRECTRLLYVRWLQAKLLKELVNVIYRFKQRHWTMIIKEHKNAHRVGLWVSTSRCLEIWDILETTNNKKFKDENILRKLLRIVQFYQKRLKANMVITPTMTTAEKNIIQTDVRLLMREHKIATRLTIEAEAWKRPYVKPELACKAHKKFQVCFECSLSLREDKMICDFCGLVSFCNLDCMIANVERPSGHPCSEKLREKYIPVPEDDDNISL